MANVWYWFGSWVSADEGGMAPGEQHHWIAWPVNWGDAVSITATPIAGIEEHVLAVSDIRMEADAVGNRRIFFTVTNVGQTYVDAYANGYGYISA
jgi:hypothetical protein